MGEPEAERFEYYNQGKQALRGGQAMMPRTKLQRLNDAKKGLEAKLSEINSAIKLLEENPKISEIIEALERAGI